VDPEHHRIQDFTDAAGLLEFLRANAGDVVDVRLEAHRRRSLTGPGP
jgi:hypothetical protein